MEKIIMRIPLECRSKKNSQRIVINARTKRPMILQSNLYLTFEKEFGLYINKYKGIMIKQPINLKCIIYTGNRRRKDLTNLLNAIQDILVKYKVIADDNYNIVQSLDGSKILYRKNQPEILIEISEAKNEK